MSRVVKLTDEKQFVLPASVLGRQDVSRILLEIEKVDYDFESQSVRNPGQPVTIPAVSRTLSEIVALNEVVIEDLESRKAMVASMRQIKDRAPGVHITFAVDAPPDATREIVQWIRQNLHPVALINTGLQPGLIGGCVIRTPDHIYDFSLRNRFKQAMPELTKALGAL